MLFNTSSKFQLQLKHNKHIIRLIAVVLVTIATSRAGAQHVVSPCPEVLIDQKYDHIGSDVYRRQGWDTVTTCTTNTLELSAEPYIPVQYFNGTYIVEEVPYNPPDPTFARGTAMPISTDDNFANVITLIPFNFYFFGIKKEQFCLGANGLVSFSSGIHTVYGSANDPGMQCTWQYSAPIPWTNNTTGAPMDLNVMRDAIYGIYEDTHPLGSYLTGNQGIYYGIQGEWPCRKIICSWKGIPPYPGSQNLNNRCTYQIVCYEGSNIIEVHVQHRGVNTSWQNGVGIIGIQNATGTPQQQGPLGDPTNYVVPNSPAAFFPAGRNTFNTELSNTAYRFTPQGTTQMTYYWYRIYDDGRPNDTLTNNQNDTNGYFLPMDETDTEHPTRTKAYVSPHGVSRYVLSLNFKNADTTWYHLRDTITIGRDTANTLGIQHAAEPDTSRRRNVCQGKSTTLSLAIPPDQTAKTINWTVMRVLNGTSVLMPESMYRLDATRRNITVHPDPMIDTLPENKIDSIVVMATCDFSNGCTNFDTFLLRVFPNFDTTEVKGICIGETFHWNANGQDYTQSTSSPVARLQSEPGCDSVVRLHLTVYDSSIVIDSRVECKPLRWINGKLYTTSNTATMEGDTIRLVNSWGCDSVVRLDLKVYPVTPKIESSIEQFDFDHPEAVLTDVSTGNDSRRWIFPTGPDQTSSTAYYTMPTGMDEAEIRLVAYSPYGCSDTATLILPFNGETFWIPNIFTPDDPAGNALFAPVSTGTLTQVMYIYNRYGMLVYHCEGLDCAWDGRDRDGNPCRQDAYAYVIRYTNKYKPDQTVTRKGAVTLIR